MQRSESIAEIAKALSAAQAEITIAKKDRKNSYFQSDYATLSSVWEAIRQPLSKNGLAILQPCRFEDGNVIVTTLLSHTSGQWISEELLMPSMMSKKGSSEMMASSSPQAIGSVMTYARRYALSAMVGVAPDDDDDGEEGQKTFRGREEGDDRRPVNQQPTNGQSNGNHQTNGQAKPPGTPPKDQQPPKNEKPKEVEPSKQFIEILDSAIRDAVKNHPHVWPNLDAAWNALKGPAKAAGFTSWSAIRECTNEQSLRNLAETFSIEDAPV